MPEGAANVEVVFCAMLQQQRDNEVGHEAERGDRHDPLTLDGYRLQQPLDADDGDAEGGQQQNK